QMHFPVQAERLVRQGLDRFRLRDVGVHAADFEILTAKVLDSGGEGFGLDVAEDDLHALAGKAGSQRLTNAAGGPGNDRDFSVEVLHRCGGGGGMAGLRRLAMLSQRVCMRSSHSWSVIM